MIDQEVSYDFGVSQIIQVMDEHDLVLNMDEHDLVLKAIVTWGSTILRPKTCY